MFPRSPTSSSHPTRDRVEASTEGRMWSPHSVGRSPHSVGRSMVIVMIAMVIVMINNFIRIKVLMIIRDSE
jgi:hypothetical protein